MRRKSVSQLVTEQFINTSHCGSGDAIPSEKELMNTMQVGRFSVRESLLSGYHVSTGNQTRKGYFFKRNVSLLSFPQGSKIAHLMMKEEDFFA